MQPLRGIVRHYDLNVPIGLQRKRDNDMIFVSADYRSRFAMLVGVFKFDGIDVIHFVNWAQPSNEKEISRGMVSLQPR